MNGTALSSPSTSSQRSDSSLPLLRVAASQTTDTMGELNIVMMIIINIIRIVIIIVVYQFHTLRRNHILEQVI